MKSEEASRAFPCIHPVSDSVLAEAMVVVLLRYAGKMLTRGQTPYLIV